MRRGYIDKSDVEAKIEELEGERDDLASEQEEVDDEDTASEAAAKDIEDRLGVLDGAIEEAKDVLKTVGEDGFPLIPESDFEDYAQELARDLEGRKAFDHWPFTCIDWKQAADELKQDYSSITYDGDDYLYRSC